MNIRSISTERLERSMGNKVLDAALDKIKHLVDIQPYKGEVETWMGSKPALFFRFKCKLSEMQNFDSEEDDEDKCPIGAYNCPPFIRVRAANGYVANMIGDRWSWASSRVERYNGSYYIEYNEFAKHSSIINLLTILYVSKYKEVEDSLREVIFNAINRLFYVNIDTVELAGVDDIIDNIIEILEIEDPRLVRRNVLLAGPPGSGKSEIVKQIIKDTPAWLHYPLKVDKEMDWSSFMRNLYKLSKFMKRKVMIIMDEIDEIGTNRDIDGATVYDLLRVMDGVQELGNIKFIATTNRPKVLDPALKRIGRFGPVIHIDVPDDNTFKKIVDFYNARYSGTVSADKVVVNRQTAVGAEIRAAFEDCIIHNQAITTKNVIANLDRIMTSKIIEEKDYV